MFKLNPKWSRPVKIDTGYGDNYQREWKLPGTYVSEFFQYWRKHSFDLKDKGFGVTKRDGQWYITETHPFIHNFSGYEDTKLEVVEESFFLAPKEVKNKGGLRTWQVDSVGKICSAIEKWGGAIDGSEMGCHARGQLILMYDGSVKMIEDVNIGDVIMGYRGIPQTVVRLHGGRQEMVKILPTKGESFVVNTNHILTVKITNGGRLHKTTGGYLRNNIIDISVKDYLKLNKTTKYDMKLIYSDAIDCWATTKQTISPYFMGAILGDGGLTLRSTITFTSVDFEVWSEIKKECDRFNWTLGETDELITKRITNSPNLFKILRDYKLFPIKCENRFVPVDYKICDKTQRLEILAGLLDTDGWYRNGGFDFCSKSRKLATDVLFIAKSLGLYAILKEKQSTCYNNGAIGTYYYVSISGDCSIIPCRIPRKVSIIRKQKKNPLLTGFTVEFLQEDEFYGFSLDGDGRFLLGNFMITHNTGKTYSALGSVRELDVNFVVICPKAVISQWKEVIDNHFKLSDKCIGIINYESLIRGKTESPIASYVKNRKTHKEEFIWKLPAKSIIIWDEAHKLKNFKTKNCKTCMKAYKQGFTQLFLSASIATSPLELRAIGTCLQMFKSAKDFYNYLYANGCTKGRWGFEFNNDKNALTKIHKSLFSDRGTRLRRDSIPNFPECEIQVDPYDLDDADTKRINQIYDEMTVELKKIEKQSKKDTANELVIRLRARQSTEIIKVPLIQEMVESAIEEGMSVVVFLNFSDSIDALAERLNTKCIFDGRLKDSVREQNKKDFQSNKERIILINSAAGGTGLSIGDLEGTHPRLSLISPDDSAFKMKQVQGRTVRENSKSKSILRYIFIKNTIEEKVANNVKQKLDNLDLINDSDLKL